MLFKFTTISEQDIQNSRGGNDMMEAINYDGNRDLLVTGRPGSGKTTVTIMRALRLHELGKRPLFLTFHNLLVYSLRNAYPQISDNIFQINSWFWQLTHENLSQYRDGAIVYDMITKLPGHRYEEVLVDEGQDLGRHLFAALPRVGQTFTVGADSAQRIHNNGADAATIEQELLLQQREIKYILLEYNYRNFVEVYDFARQFVPDYQAANLEVILNNTTKGSGGSDRLPRVIQVENKFDRLVNLLEENSTSNVAIALYYQRDVEYYWRELRSRGIACSKYHNDMDRSQRRALESDMQSVLITTYKSLKGLEFQVVILPGMEDAMKNPLIETGNHYYVGCTRATERLYLLYEGDTLPDCLQSFRANSFLHLTAGSTYSQPTRTEPVTAQDDDLPF